MRYVTVCGTHIFGTTFKQYDNLGLSLQCCLGCVIRNSRHTQQRRKVRARASKALISIIRQSRSPWGGEMGDPGNVVEHQTEFTKIIDSVFCCKKSICLVNYRCFLKISKVEIFIRRARFWRAQST